MKVRQQELVVLMRKEIILKRKEGEHNRKIVS